MNHFFQSSDDMDLLLFKKYIIKIYYKITVLIGIPLQKWYEIIWICMEYSYKSLSSKSDNFFNYTNVIIQKFKKKKKVIGMSCIKQKFKFCFNIITETQRPKEFYWERNILTCFILTIPHYWEHHSMLLYVQQLTWAAEKRFVFVHWWENILISVCSSKL